MRDFFVGCVHFCKSSSVGGAFNGTPEVDLPLALPVDGATGIKLLDNVAHSLKAQVQMQDVCV
jgi:hypothetical protein